MNYISKYVFRLRQQKLDGKLEIKTFGSIKKGNFKHNSQ